MGPLLDTAVPLGPIERAGKAVSVSRHHGAHLGSAPPMIEHPHMWPKFPLRNSLFEKNWLRWVTHPIFVHKVEGECWYDPSGGKPRSFAQSNTRTQCITPQSPLNKVDRWGGRREGRATYKGLITNPCSGSHTKCLFSPEKTARKRGERSAQFSFFKL